VGRKVGISRDDVVAAAATAADRLGIEALTLSGVAQVLGVRPPSLYAHVDGLPGLRRLLALRGAEVLRAELEEAVAGADGVEALERAGRTMRSMMLRHPGLYGAGLPAARADEDPELYEAQRAAAQPVVEAATAAGLVGDDAVHAVRALRAAVHGFVLLERDGGFAQPAPVQESFTVLLRAVVDGAVHGAARR
jgi:AcrR family transcriptional regulator